MQQRLAHQVEVQVLRVPGEGDSGIMYNDPDLAIEWPMELIGGEGNLIISEKDKAFEVFFKDAGFRVMFPESNWDKDLFMLYDAIGKGFRKDLLCASEVDMRFHGFAYIKNFDKRCING